ncbi:MAG: hypothetical protein ABWK01_08040, partial [Infirmifilum sp.]
KPLKHLTRMLETLPEIGKIDGVIIGHTHVPELIVENNRVYANPGAWVENSHKDICTFIRISNNHITLGKWENSQAITLNQATL